MVPMWGPNSGTTYIAACCPQAPPFNEPTA